MSSRTSFEELQQGHLAFVESARNINFEEGLKSLLSDMYPDNAHFIYELLQNAEDALATAVDFTLADECLVVSHNGARAFSLADVEAITSIGNSPKKDDPTQIGQFGVGFKSVFAYTTRPEIRSGDFAFAIEDLYVPQVIDGAAKDGWTTFSFPFDHPRKSAATACEEVAAGLTQLDEKTLLFLSNINTITYELPDGTIGILERTEVAWQMIRIMKAEGTDLVESHWLRLIGPTSLDGGDGHSLAVAAAFRLESVESVQGRKTEIGSTQAVEASWSIVPVERGEVSIYFPAVKETSGLHFHVHAPFASTVARDSVRVDSANDQLIADLAALIADALPDLCVRGFVTDGLLAALPNKEDQLGPRFTPVRDAIICAFNELPITPVRRESVYAPATSLVTSPSDFRTKLDQSDLVPLLALADIPVALPPRWIRDRDGRAGRFLAGLDTIQFGWRELDMALGHVRGVEGHPDFSLGYVRWADHARYMPIWHSWLEGKTDKRLVEFYRLMGQGRKAHALALSGLREVPIVRLRRRGKVEHVKGPSTYLPSGPGDKAQSRVPVDLAYFDSDSDQDRTYELQLFYRAAGVERWNETTKVEQLLGSYSDLLEPLPAEFDFGKHLEDVREFVRFGLAHRDSALDMFANVPFVAIPHSDGVQRWAKPSEIYLDEPFRDTGLATLYPTVKWHFTKTGIYANDGAPYALPGMYFDVANIAVFLEVVGARAKLRIEQTDVKDNPLFSPEWRDGYRENANGMKIDWTVDRLAKLLNSRDRRLLKSLWEVVVAAPRSQSRAIYKANHGAPRHLIESQLAQALKRTAWVLDRDGELRYTRDINIDDVSPDWDAPSPESLVHELGFGLQALRHRRKREQASEFLRDEGLDEDGLDFLHKLKTLGLSAAEAFEQLKALAEAGDFPSRGSEDPERRAAVAAEDAVAAPIYGTERRERSVAIGRAEASAAAKEYLRHLYEDRNGEMKCQLCQQRMPFRTSDGRWYFEAREFVTGLGRLHKSNFIALCPLCAALYKYKRDTPDSALRERLAATSVAAGQGRVTIPVTLNSEDRTVTFVGKHAVDLKAALAVAGDAR